MEAKAKDCDTYDGGTGRRVEKKKGSRAVGATRHSWRTHPTVTENGQRSKSKVPTRPSLYASSRSMLLVKVRYVVLTPLLLNCAQVKCW